MNATAARFRTFRADIFNAVTHLAGFDIFINGDDRGLGFFNFARYPTPHGNWHLFGLGRQVVVSRLPRR